MIDDYWNNHDPPGPTCNLQRSPSPAAHATQATQAAPASLPDTGIAAGGAGDLLLAADEHRMSQPMNGEDAALRTVKVLKLQLQEAAADLARLKRRVRRLLVALKAAQGRGCEVWANMRPPTCGCGSCIAHRALALDRKEARKP